jgi:hypothetical protein
MLGKLILLLFIVIVMWRGYVHVDEACESHHRPLSGGCYYFRKYVGGAAKKAADLETDAVSWLF